MYTESWAFPDFLDLAQAIHHKYYMHHNFHEDNIMYGIVLAGTL
jgi:hypothetical protein